MKSRGKQRNKKGDERQAIRQYCVACSGNDFQEVRDCELVDCALYRFRTGDGKQDSLELSESIQGFCMWCRDESSDEIFGCENKECPLYSFRIVDSKPEKWTRAS